MRVLFASGIDGFCHRYAVLHWAEQLRTQGIEATARAHVDPRLVGDLAHHDVLVLYRVPTSPWIAHLLGEARRCGRPTVCALDDLIFDDTIPEPRLLRDRDESEQRAWHDGVRRYRATLTACDVFLATSGPLVAAGKRARTPTHLHRAGLGNAELACADAVPPRRRDGRVRLGYFSGTPTHDADFGSISAPLAAIMEEHPEVQLVLGGLVTLAPALAPFEDRVHREPWRPWTELPACIARVDVNLAPLDWEDPFTGAKGAIKYLEAAAVGVPTIASPTEAFRHAITHERTGLLAADPTAWQDALRSLVRDADTAARLGDAARRDVRARFTSAAQGPALAEIMHTIAQQASPTLPPPALADEATVTDRFPDEVARTAREPAALPDLAAPPIATPTAPLPDGTVLAQRFPARLNGLARIDVHSISYGQRLAHVVALRVRRDDGVAIASERYPAALAPDRDWLAVEFAPQADSAGARYTLELEAEGTGPGNALSFGTTPLGPVSEPLSVDGVPGGSALAVRTFATGGPA